MDFKKISESSLFHKAVIVTGLALAAIILFRVGVTVGFHEARESYGMGEDYFYRAVGGHPGISEEFVGAIPGAYGAAGTVMSVTVPTFVVSQPDQTEKIIRMATTTAIRFERTNTTTAAIAPGSFVVVVGTPGANDELDATLIRLLPPPDDFPPR